MYSTDMKTGATPTFIIWDKILTDAGSFIIARNDGVPSYVYTQNPAGVTDTPHTIRSKWDGQFNFAISNAGQPVGDGMYQSRAKHGILRIQ